MYLESPPDGRGVSAPWSAPSRGPTLRWPVSVAIWMGALTGSGFADPPWTYRLTRTLRWRGRSRSAMAGNEPLPSLFVMCRKCGLVMIKGWLGGEINGNRADLIWIDNWDEGKWTDLTNISSRNLPAQIEAYRCNRCGMVELHFPEGYLARTMSQGFPSE